jgi:hypothetical protein
MNPPQYFTTIFCDDVRREEGGKLSLMGIYTGALAVPSFPSVLPRLCFIMTLRTSPDAIPSTLRYRLHKDDELVAESVISSDALATARSAKVGDDRTIQFTTIFQASPLILTEACFLRARADCDGEEFKGGSLAVMLQKDLIMSDWAPTPPSS